MFNFVINGSILIKLCWNVHICRCISNHIIEKHTCPFQVEKWIIDDVSRGWNSLKIQKGVATPESSPPPPPPPGSKSGGFSEWKHSVLLKQLICELSLNFVNKIRWVLVCNQKRCLSPFLDPNSSRLTY